MEECASVDGGLRHEQPVNEEYVTTWFDLDSAGLSAGLGERVAPIRPDPTSAHHIVRAN